MNEATHQEPRKPRRVWLLILGASLALVLLTVGTLWWYLRSDGDLQEFGERLRAQGILTSVDETEPPLSESAHVESGRRIDQLVKAITLYRSFLLPSTDTALPQEFIEHHQKIDSARVCDIAQEIIALDPKSFVVRPGRGHIADWSWQKLLTERLLIADPAEAALCVEASYRLIEMNLTPAKFFQSLSVMRDVSRVWTFQGPDQRMSLKAMAPLFEQLTTRMLAMYGQVTKYGLIQDWRSIGHGEQFCKERGTLLPERLTYPLCLDFAMRVDRMRMLEAELEWFRLVEPSPNQPHQWCIEAQRRWMLPAFSRQVGWLGEETTRSILWLQNPLTIQMLARYVMHLRLLVAEVESRPWPLDLLDPLERQVRTLVRDGQVIGAYSVGADGVDDGGDRRKDVWLLLKPVSLRAK